LWVSEALVLLHTNRTTESVNNVRKSPQCQMGMEACLRVRVFRFGLLILRDL
jgi:hypothetical protein